MSVSYHKAILPTGGGIGDEIYSGVVGALLPIITPTDQSTGIKISKKIFLKNNGSTTVTGTFSLDSYSEFPTILFESTGDSQLEGDLLGNETDESPISISIASGEHLSFWVQVQVPASSSSTNHYNTIDTKANYD